MFNVIFFNVFLIQKGAIQFIEPSNKRGSETMTGFFLHFTTDPLSFLTADIMCADYHTKCVSLEMYLTLQLVY